MRIGETMFRTAPVAESAHDLMVPAEPPVPISHLAFGLPEPSVGWTAYLNAKGVEVVVDDVGRSAISRVAARQLFDEHRASEARKAELRAAAEQRAIETDQQFRAQLGRGVPASAFGGMTYGQAVASAELDSQAYRPRASVVEDLLDNGGGGYVFHPIQHNADE
jgi:hypothetical protein